MLVVLLDAYHLGDPLFVSQLARDVAARKEGLVFVHGSGDAGERALEARGGVAVAHGGVWAVSTEAEALDVERATRELNRSLVHEMNEAGVPAVRVMGADRGLLSRAPGGGLRAGRTSWLATLVAQGGVGVVAALVAGDGPALGEVDAAQAAAVLAEALGAEAVVLLATGRTPGLAGAGGPDGRARVLPAATLAEAVAGGTLPDVALAERLVDAARGPVVVTSAAQIRTPGPVAGTRIGSESGA